MKYVFLAAILVLSVMSAWAWHMMPHVDTQGRQQLVWASDDNPRRRDQIEEFNKLYPQYLLTLDANNGGGDKVVTQSLAGVGPDIFDGFRGQGAIFLDAGLLYDVTDKLIDPKTGKKYTLADIWPLAHTAISLNGRIYGIPCNVSGDAIWYHKDVFDEEHVPYPPETGWTWDEFVKTAQKLTKVDEHGRTTRFGIYGLSWDDVRLTNGGRILTPDGRKCVIDSEACIDALQKWLDLQNKYKVLPTAVDEASMSTQGGWGTGGITYLQEKHVAMAVGGRWWLSTMRDLPKDANGEFPLNLGVCEKPITKIPRFSGVARVAFINAMSPNRDKAVQFLIYLMSDEYSDQLNRDADGMPARIDASAGPNSAYNYDPSHGRDGGNSPVWKELSGVAVNEELSPYITVSEMNDAIKKHIDLARAGTETPAEALHKAAARVNQIIAQNLARDPSLKAKYDNGDTSPAYGNFVDNPQATTAPAQ